MRRRILVFGYVWYVFSPFFSLSLREHQVDWAIFVFSHFSLIPPPFSCFQESLLSTSSGSSFSPQVCRVWLLTRLPPFFSSPLLVLEIFPPLYRRPTLRRPGVAGNPPPKHYGSPSFSQYLTRFLSGRILSPLTGNFLRNTTPPFFFRLGLLSS